MVLFFSVGMRRPLAQNTTYLSTKKENQFMVLFFSVGMRRPLAQNTTYLSTKKENQFMVLFFSVGSADELSNFISDFEKVVLFIKTHKY